MSRATFALDSDSAQSSKSRSTSLRVNRPGDAYEAEADRVADTVSNGGKVTNLAGGFSLSKLNASSSGEVAQRDPSGAPPPAPGPAPKPNNYDEGLKKIGEAFLKTEAGKQILEAIKKDELVKGAEGFLDTLPGKIIAGAAATGAVSALAATHTPLPAQIPEIPLDFLKPGLSVKITYEGPVDKPTKAAISFSYTPKSASDDKKKPKQSATEKQREANIKGQNDLYNYQEGLKSPYQRRLEAAEDQQALNRWVGRPNAPTSLTGGLDPSKYTGVAPGLADQPTGPQLTTPPLQSPFQPKHPSLLDKKLELKPIPGLTADPAADAKKKEEIPVQRKAQPNTEVSDMYADPAVVESVIHSPGRPLDPETRRVMESRIGFDFSRVRIHTDSKAASSAQSLGARAYTVGNSVVFNAGRYAPNTAAGNRLLAHELTHVVQQTAPAHRPHAVIRPAPKPGPRLIQRFLGIELPNVKDWLIGKVKDIKGYNLFCVVIGQDLFTGQQVERNATNLTQGVLELFPDGPALFEKLKQAANAVQTAYQWLLGQLTELELTPEYFSKLVDRLVAAVDLGSPFQSWDRVKAIVAEPLGKCIELAKRVGKAVFDFILKALLETFPLGKKVYELFKKTGAVLSQIAADPMKFAKNLLTAVSDGFSNFGKNILTHLGEGVKTWIFEELNIKGVTIPTEFSFASILKLILQVLGLTYDQLRPKLVTKLTEPVVYFFETAAKVLDRIQKEGFSAVWDMIKTEANSVFEGLLGSLKSWIAKEIVEKAILIVAKLASPVGAVIEAIQSIYEVITFIIDKAAKLVDLIETVVNALSDIVNGVLGPAAQKVEDSLAKTIPIMLRFLAGLLHLSGIGKSIREIIDKIRAPIEKVIDKVLDMIVDKAKPLWEKGKEAFMGKLGALKEWWKKPKKFKLGEEDHEVAVEGEGDHPQVFVQSTKTPIEHFLSDVKATPKQTKSILKLAGQLGWRQGEAQKPADDEKGSKIYDKLRDELDNLKAREAPKSLIKYPKSPHSLGGGVEADAFLSSNREPGTEPNGTDPDIWNDLGPDLRRQKSYVRGHLLSMRLGGEGIWKNMMPITNTVNQRMNAQVESKLKKATVPGNNHFYHYNIQAKYGDDVLPPLDDKAKAADKKARATAAEQRLISLTWTVKPAEFDKDKGGWKESAGDLLDADGKPMDARVAAGDFTPPTVSK
jgi:hypothetical protein